MAGEVFVMNSHTYKMFEDTSTENAFETDDPIEYLRIFFAMNVHIDDDLPLGRVEYYDRETFEEIYGFSTDVQDWSYEYRDDAFEDDYFLDDDDYLDDEYYDDIEEDVQNEIRRFFGEDVGDTEDE